MVEFEEWSKTVDQLAERDLLLYTGVDNESTFTMNPGSFAVFFPMGVHRPSFAVDQPQVIRKVVIEVPASLLA